MTWTPVPSATSYNIYYGTSATESIASHGAVVASVSATPSVITGLLDGTQYYFTVTAVSAAGESSESVTVSATTESASPTGVSIGPGNQELFLAWASALGATSYNLYYNTSPGVTPGGPGVTKVPLGNVTAATVASLANGTPYYFVVTAVNGGGESAPSAEVSSAPSASNTWSTVQPMPTARYGLMAEPVGGIIYAIGGVTFQSTNVVEAYDPVANTWSTKTSLPAARGMVAGTTVGGKIYVFGGEDVNGSLTSTAYVYDPLADSWSALPNMPTARCCMAVAAVGSVIYVIGGYSGTGITNVVESYDTASGTSGTWLTPPAMPTKRYFLGAQTVNNVVYALGGYATGVGNLATVESYDPVANTWTTQPHLFNTHQGPATANVGGLIYVFTGVGSMLNSAESYDPTNGTATEVAAIPTQREDAAAAVVNGVIYVMGGYWGTSVYATNEAYTP